MDFSTNFSIKEIKKIVKECLKDFDLLNIKYKTYSEKEFEGNLRIEIRFEGPLFKGNKSSTNTLKIDFNKQKAENKITKVVQKLFSDVPLFTIIVLDEKEILAEKIRALVNRKESRDLYDLWILLNQNIEIDKKLLFKKLKEENSKIKDLNFPLEEEYVRDLKELVGNLPDYKQVIKEVKEKLKEIKAS